MDTENNLCWIRKNHVNALLCGADIFDRLYSDDQESEIDKDALIDELRNECDERHRHEDALEEQVIALGGVPVKLSSGGWSEEDITCIEQDIKDCKIDRDDWL